MPVEFELFEVLKRKRLKLAVAESCTGGLVAARIVNVPGISEFFLGGVVSYSNEAKEKLLGVDKKVIETFGAVSPQTALSMAEGAVRIFGADCALSTTGVAGPSGGTAEKPVGLVFIGLVGPAGKKVFRFVFKDKHPDAVARRNAIRKKAAKKAIKLLKDFLEGRL